MSDSDVDQTVSMSRVPSPPLSPIPGDGDVTPQVAIARKKKTKKRKHLLAEDLIRSIVLNKEKPLAADSADEKRAVPTGAGEATEESEWKTVHILPALYTDRNEEERSDQPQWCFFCDYSPNRGEVVENDRYTHVWEYAMRFRGRLDRKWHIARIQELYNDVCREFTELKLPFYKSRIEEHMMGKHNIDETAVIERQIRVIDKMMQVIEENHLEAENRVQPWRHALDLRYAKEYRELSNSIRPLIKDLNRMRPGGLM
jgi:hypothetical protein